MWYYVQEYSKLCSVAAGHLHEDLLASATLYGGSLFAFFHPLPDKNTNGIFFLVYFCLKQRIY